MRESSAGRGVYESAVYRCAIQSIVTYSVLTVEVLEKQDDRRIGPEQLNNTETQCKAKSDIMA